MPTRRPKRTHRKHFTRQAVHVGYSADKLGRLAVWLDSIGSTTDDRNEADLLVEDLASYNTAENGLFFIPKSVEDRIREHAESRLADKEPADGSLIAEILWVTAEEKSLMTGAAVMRLRKARLLSGLT